VPGLSDHRITLAGLFFEAEAALRRATTPTFERHGISPQWFEALLRLARSDEHRLRMSDLAHAMTSITPSGLTRLVDRLEEEGLVRRERCPSDRRGAFAVITDEGMARVEAVLPDHLDDLQQWYVSRLEKDEMVRFEASLRAIRDAVDAR
jgi:MarR family 2-MHQ and catechol resistance regulon transcriptional repressor